LLANIFLCYLWCVFTIFHICCRLFDDLKSSLYNYINRFCAFALILPPFIYDRMNNSNPYFCDTSAVAREYIIYLSICGNHIPSLVMVACSFKVYQKVRKRYRSSIHPKTKVIGVQPKKELNPVPLIDDATTSTTWKSMTATHGSCIAPTSSVDKEVLKTDFLNTRKINFTSKEYST